jgi:hypothetical protein
MAKIVPTVSSSAAGPLGAVHLPRFWLKQTLANEDLLADGYDSCGGGFDQMTLDGLGLDKEKTLEYLRTHKPTYVVFEEWVVTNGKADKASIEKHNAAVRAYNHSDELGAQMRKSSGLKHEHVKDAVMLNMLEDLDEVHHTVTKK